MQIVILCGGLATRLYPLTKKIPKAMIRIGGKPFLEYQLELVKKNGISDVVLCIGYKGNKIKKYFGNGKKWGLRITYSSDEKKLLGTGGALKKAEPLLDDVFLVMWGDSYLPFNFQEAIEFFKKHNKLGLMTVYKNENRIEPSNVEIKGNLVKAYSKKRKTKRMKYIDYGLSIFKKEVLKYIPKNKFYDLSKLNQLLIRKKQLLAFPVKRRFYQIGTFEGLEEFKRKYKKLTKMVKNIKIKK
jgi:N-acetyl-alpha-D-muramate 1-phosphate uridylyltransferase